MPIDRSLWDARALLPANFAKPGRSYVSPQPSGHGQDVCECGRVIGSCRCSPHVSGSTHTLRTYANGCPDCQEKTGLLPTLTSCVPILPPQGGKGFVSPPPAAFATTIDHEEVAKVAATIKHCGDYGKCWVHPEQHTVFWSMADGDGSPGGTSEKEIRAKFAAIPGVQKVEIGDEYSPPRNQGWQMVHPRQVDWSQTVMPPQNAATSTTVDFSDRPLLDDLLSQFICLTECKSSVPNG